MNTKLLLFSKFVECKKKLIFVRFIYKKSWKLFLDFANKSKSYIYKDVNTNYILRFGLNNIILKA